MTRNVMLVPAGKTTGIYTASLGLVQALNNNGINAVLFTPFVSCSQKSCSSNSLSKCCAAKKIANDLRSEVLETIVANYNALKTQTNADVIVIEGVCEAPFDKDSINAEICHAFDASVITVVQCACKCAKSAIDATLQFFGSKATKKNLGSILINPKAPKDANGHKKLVLSGCGCCCSDDKESCSTEDSIKDFLATVNFDKFYYAPRAKDIASYLDAEIVSGDENARGFKVTLNALKTNERSVLVTDTCPQSCEAKIVILTDGAQGSVDGATVIATDKSAWSVAQSLADMKAELRDDEEQIAYIKENASKDFGKKIIDAISSIEITQFPLMSPAAFRNKLTELARAANKKIALPEGDEPRTVCAAAKVAEQKIAIPVLFGNKDKILSVAKEQGVVLGENVEFVDPDEVRKNYVDRLVELRKAKGMTPELALEMLKDNVALATLMIERNELDGLVSGAVHTTANTIRPPLQIIKTAPNAKLVSAIFFMLMPEQVYVYGDCALNIDPDAEQLSEIAIQSADTAKAFGIDPKVAMVTYSTMNSGKGADVDLMRNATELVRQKRPDIAIDGPLQYDAAVMPDVAAQKAPNSPVAGKATVFIFPSLSTGNTVYKAVQRSANLVSIGPMLQGMRKPVNDLSRGALVDDIIYTIAVTAIQAGQNQE
ncbi:MAG: phosphate acetyltransferase [Succinivibrio sp.]